MANYMSWLENPYFDEDTRAELESIKGDEKEIEAFHYILLFFGAKL